MKRLTTTAQVNDPYFLMSTEGFKELLKQGVIKAIKTGTKNDRDIYIFVHGPFFVEFSCNKDFSNIRIKKKPPKRNKPPKIQELKELKEKIEKTGGTYVPGSEGYFNNKRVQQFFAIIDNTPITYWVNEDRDIYGIEAV